jgi:hypothetical protein
VSDWTLNRFLARGTAAERAAFVPSPPTPASGPDPGYSWYETDTGDLYQWDGAAWQPVVGSGTGDVVGPASSVDNRIATFDGITGKLLQDSGETIADVIADAVAGAAADILPVNLASEVTGDLPLANLAPSAAASRLLGRGDSGAGDWQPITLGTNLAMSGSTLNATGGGGTGDVVGPASAVDDRIATFDGVTGKLLQDGGDTIADVITDAVTAAVAAIVPVDLATDVTGDLPLANLAQASAASRVLGRGSASGAGDFQELTIGSGLSITGTVLATTAAAGGTATIACLFDGMGAAPTAGAKKPWVLVPFAHTITVSYIFADVSGSAVIDVWRDTYANFPPTVADTITASAKPTLSGAIKATDATLTGWSTTGAANDVYMFNLDSVATCTVVGVQLTVTRT